VAQVRDRLARMVVDAQGNHPLHFAPFLSTHLQFFTSVLPPLLDLRPLGLPLPAPKFVILATGFISNVCSDRSYDPDAGVNDTLGQHLTKTSIAAKGSGAASTAENLTLAVSTVASFFTPAAVTTLARLAVTRLMPLSPDKLDAWHADPEDYMVSESQASAKDDARAAGEGLFLSLIESKRGKDLLSAFVADMLLDAKGQIAAAGCEAGGGEGGEKEKKEGGEEGGSQAVLLWDAVYVVARARRLGD
jgi:hypothetical protein